MEQDQRFPRSRGRRRGSGCARSNIARTRPVSIRAGPSSNRRAGRATGSRARTARWSRPGTACRSPKPRATGSSSSTPTPNPLVVETRNGKLVLDGRLRTAARKLGRRMAAVPALRRPLLHLSAFARPQGRGGLRDPHRAASALLHRSDQHDADRGSGADPALVADDLFSRVQGAAGRRQRTSSGRANRSCRFWSCPRRPTSNSSRCPRTRPRSGELQSQRIYESRKTLSADSEWTSATNTVFDGTYRHILGAAAERARRNR